MLSIKMKQSYDSPTIIMFLMLLYLISTLIQGVLPISINRILLFLIIILIIIDFLSSSTKTRMIVVLYSLFVFLYMLLISTELGTSLRDMIYFLSTIMILLFFSEKRNFKCFKFALIRYEYIITKILYLLLFLTILSLFLNSSYIINWSDSYYVGFVGMPHTAASSLCLLMAFFLLIFNDKSFKFYRLCILVCLIGIIFKTGARTFIVPALLICFLYIKDVLKNKWIKMFVYVFVASLITYIFINSNMMDKFLWSADSANQYTSNALSSMTGGRSSFWKIDLHVFFNQNPIFQIIGRGFDFPYLTNLKYYNMHIWAHNDIIDILLSLGYLGCFAYIFIWNIFLKNIFKQKKNKVLYFILLIYIFFPMLINGVFIAQHYLFSIIIFSICITSKKEKALL